MPILYFKKDNKIYLKTKSYLDEKKDKNIKEKLDIINEILSIKNKEERYNLLFDRICEYLDNEFIGKNICGFECGLCLRKKELMKTNPNKETYLNGCCYSYKEGKNCKYLDINKGGCQIKNIACKLYTCHYLRKKGYKYHLRYIYLARYLLNFRQRLYIETTYFVPKEVVIKGLIKRS